MLSPARNMALATWIFVFFVLAGCDLRHAPSDQGDARAIVKVGSPVYFDEPAQFVAYGKTRAVHRAKLAFISSGYLLARDVDIGDSVSEGEVVARMDNPTLAPSVRASEARIAELDARIEQLERDIQRLTELRESRAASEDQLEQKRSERQAALAARQSAVARLAEAQASLARAELTAPFSGEVAAVHQEPGEFVAAGQPVLDLVNNATQETVFSVSENVVTQLRLGDEVHVQFPVARRDAVVGTIKQIAAGSSNSLYDVAVAIPNVGLPSGTSARVLLTGKRMARLTVPSRAVVETGTGKPRVYRVIDGKARAVPVTLGELVGENVVVVSDLGQDDTIIVDGLAKVMDGRPVEIVE